MRIWHQNILIGREYRILLRIKFWFILSSIVQPILIIYLSLNHVSVHLIPLDVLSHEAAFFWHSSHRLRAYLFFVPFNIPHGFLLDRVLSIIEYLINVLPPVKLSFEKLPLLHTEWITFIIDYGLQLSFLLQNLLAHNSHLLTFFESCWWILLDIMIRADFWFVLTLNWWFLTNWGCNVLFYMRVI